MYANNVNKHQIESLKLKLQKFCLKKNISIKSLSLALIQAILCSCTPMAKNPELNSKSLDGIQNLDNSYYVDMPNQKIYFIASDNKPIDIEFSNINPIVEENVDIASLSLDRRINYLMEKYNVTYEDFIKIATNNAGYGIDSCYQELYDEIQNLIPFAEKLNYILDMLGISFNHFDTTAAVCLAEAFGDGCNYTDSYATGLVVANRLISKETVRYISTFFGKNSGLDPYYQVIAPNQFSVYASGDYKNFLGRTDLLGYQAVVDAFFYYYPLHEFISFRDVSCARSAYIQFVKPEGNAYLLNSKLTEEDINYNSPILARRND